MKKLLIIFIVVCMSFSMIACGNATNETDVEKSTDISREKTDQKDNKSETKSDGNVEMGNQFKTGSYDVIINSVRRIQDYEGNPAIVVNCDWTNNSEETTSWLGSMNMDVFQDGKQSSSAMVMEGMDNELSMTSVRPGIKLEGLEMAFLTESENPLEIEIQAIEEMFNEEPNLIKVNYPAE